MAAALRLGGDEVSESLSDRAVSTVARILELDVLLRHVIDYGSADGFCAEKDQIENDAMQQLLMLRSRANALNYRIQKKQEDRAPCEPSVTDDEISVTFEDSRCANQ